MDDQLAYIKTNYTDEGLGCLMSEDDILWLVNEVERLRADLAHADRFAAETPKGAGHG